MSYLLRLHLIDFDAILPFSSFSLWVHSRANVGEKGGVFSLGPYRLSESRYHFSSDQSQRSHTYARELKIPDANRGFALREYHDSTLYAVTLVNQTCMRYGPLNPQNSAPRVA